MSWSMRLATLRSPSQPQQRSYPTSEIRELVELFRDDPELTLEKFSGMDYLAAMLEYLESKSDQDIAAEVRAFCRANPFFPLP